MEDKRGEKSKKEIFVGIEVREVCLVLLMIDEQVGFYPELPFLS